MTRPTTRSLRWRWQTLIDEKDRQWLNGDQSFYFNRIMDLGQPVEDNDAATKKYVDDFAETELIGVPGHIPIIQPDGSGLDDSGVGITDFEIAGAVAAHVVAVNHGIYPLPMVIVDHANASPVVLGTVPSNSLVALNVICLEAPVGPPALTLGDEDTPNNHMTYLELPDVINDAVIGKNIFYPATKELRATISGVGTAGKWQITPSIIRLG